MPQPTMRIARQLALDILEIDLVPAFGHFAINVSAARMDVEADLPPRCRYIHDLPHVGPADIQICFDNVVSLKTHCDDKNMFIWKGRIDLPPERLKRFRSARVPDRFQFMKAGVGGHDAINHSRVRRDDRFREAQEMPEELGLWSIGFQDSSD